MTTQGAVGSSSSRGCGTPAAAKRSRCRDFVVARTAVGAVDRMRQAEPLCDARGDPDRPVGSGRDDPVDVLGAGEAVDARLVLGRDERPLVRVGEAGRRGIAVDRDHEEVALACRAQEPDLRGPRS